MEKTSGIYGKSSILPVLEFQRANVQNCKLKDSHIPCLRCEETFQFPKDQDEYLAHLFLVHRLVIADVDEIVLLEEYLKFWKKELEHYELEEYCTTMLLDQLPDGTPGKNEKYYLLSDILPKDYELRVKLKRECLENALAQHQFELTDRNFSRECLYCRDVITGLRSLYLEHLFNKHFLQLGKPQNLVYIDELIAKVQNNLENLICLYCEGVFKDRVTLKEHMRKKAHKRINPNNKLYDKYFLENYKFFGLTRHTKKQSTHHKKQYQRQTKSFETPTQRNCSSSQRISGSINFEEHYTQKSEDSDSDWSDWNGDEMSIQPLNCLYCQVQSQDFTQFKQHLVHQHSMDFGEAIKGLNFYQRVKVVNYIRHQICLLRCVTCNERMESLNLLLQHLEEEQHFGIGSQKQWDKPEYFFPTYEDDGLLCILDDSPNDNMDDTVVRIISEDPVAQINKDAEKLSLENFNFL